MSEYSDIPNFSHSIQNKQNVKNGNVKALPNYQDKIKAIAIIAMIIDHIGLYFFPGYESLRAVGRIAMPIFCFFAGYNFKGIKFNILFYGLFLTVLINSVNYIIGLNKLFPFNMLVTIFIGYIYLNNLYYPTSSILKNFAQIAPLVILTPITYEYFEYGTLSIAVMVIGYICKRELMQSSEFYFLLISILCALNSQVIFWFDFANFIILLGMCMILYFFLSGISKGNIIIEDKISYYLSRNVIYIYVIHLSLLEIYRGILYYNPHAT